ncbi:MAG: hypothetical protein NC409_07075 [Clostridium sp.]|nr:hypothetical protein [Clostridium sp.]
MPQQIRFLSMDFFVALMITFFVLAILSQILIGILYQHMIEEAENMPTTDNRILQQFKQKFVNCYTVNDGVTNVPVFVEKFLNRLQIGRFSLNMIRGMSGQFMFLSVLSAGIGICRALAAGASFFSLLPYYAVILIGLYFYFSVLSIVDIPGRRSMLKTNLIDFLENNMKVRLAAGLDLEAVQEDGVQAETDLRGEAGVRKEHAFMRAESGEARVGRQKQTRIGQQAERRTARWDTDEDFDRKRMPVLEKAAKETHTKPEGLDWTGGMMDAPEKEKPFFDKEKEEELAELLKDLLS